MFSFSSFRAVLVRNVELFFIILALVGIMVLAMSTVVKTPYFVEEDYSYVRHEGTWYNQTLTLGPNETFQSGDWFIELWVNHTILQIQISSSGPLRFQFYKLVELPVVTNELLFGDQIGGFPENFGKEWLYYEWTSPGPVLKSYQNPSSIEGDYFRIYFTLENLGGSDTEVHFQVDSYFTDATGKKQATDYKPIIEESYAYLGLGFIVTALVLEFVSWRAHRQTYSPSKRPTQN
jgi:hypothetical protein